MNYISIFKDSLGSQVLCVRSRKPSLVRLQASLSPLAELFSRFRDVLRGPTPLPRSGVSPGHLSGSKEELVE